MKNIFSNLFALLFLGCLTTQATEVLNNNPATLVGPNPQQSGSFTITNTTPGLFTNTVTFPVAYNAIPIVTLYNTSTNAANNPLTNSITLTNFTVITASTNAQINWTSNYGYPRVETGIFNLGAFPAGTVAITNTFNPPFAQIPIVNVQGNGSLFATNAGAWVTVTTTNFVLTTGNTNQIFYWGVFGIALNPGYNIVTY